jgi:hypothetical protein
MGADGAGRDWAGGGGRGVGKLGGRGKDKGSTLDNSLTSTGFLPPTMLYVTYEVGQAKRHRTSDVCHLVLYRTYNVVRVIHGL